MAEGELSEATTRLAILEGRVNIKRETRAKEFHEFVVDNSKPYQEMNYFERGLKGSDELRQKKIQDKKTRNGVIWKLEEDRLDVFKEKKEGCQKKVDNLMDRRKDVSSSLEARRRELSDPIDVNGPRRNSSTRPIAPPAPPPVFRRPRPRFREYDSVTAGIGAEGGLRATSGSPLPYSPSEGSKASPVKPFVRRGMLRSLPAGSPPPDSLSGFRRRNQTGRFQGDVGLLVRVRGKSFQASLPELESDSEQDPPATVLRSASVTPAPAPAPAPARAESFLPDIKQSSHRS